MTYVHAKIMCADILSIQSIRIIIIHSPVDITLLLYRLDPLSVLV
jgi:hypothetical protein